MPFGFVQIAEEAGALVTRMDGKDFTVFDRSVIASNGKLHPQVSPFVSHTSCAKRLLPAFCVHSGSASRICKVKMKRLNAGYSHEPFAFLELEYRNSKLYSNQRASPFIFYGSAQT